MSWGTEFVNPSSGEKLIHRDRPDGTRDLLIIPPDGSDHGHAVLDPSGNPRYIRETDGRVVADDSKG